MHLLLLFLPVVLGGTSDPIELGKKFKKEISKDHTFKVQIQHSPTKPGKLINISHTLMVKFKTSSVYLQFLFLQSSPFNQKPPAKATFQGKIERLSFQLLNKRT